MKKIAPTGDISTSLLEQLIRGNKRPTPRKENNNQEKGVALNNNNTQGYNNTQGNNDNNNGNSNRINNDNNNENSNRVNNSDNSLLAQIIIKGVLPPPITVVTEPLTEENRDLPGITETVIPDKPKYDFVQESLLLKKYLIYEKPVRFLIDIFDNWLKNVLPVQIARQKIIFLDGSRARFDTQNLNYLAPSYSFKSKTLDLYPQKARNDHMTYSFEIRCDLIKENHNPTTNEWQISDCKKSEVIGSIPLMLGSEICHLRGKSSKDLQRLGEDPSDCFGYFIINGSEKITLIQEMLRLNKIFLFNLSSKGNPVCRVTIPTGDRTIIVQLSIGNRGAFKFGCPTLGKNNKGKPKTLGVFQLLNLLGLESIDDMVNEIAQFTKKEWRSKVLSELIPSKAKYQLARDTMEYVANKFLKRKDNSKGKKGTARLDELARDNLVTNSEEDTGVKGKRKKAKKRSERPNTLTTSEKQILIDNLLREDIFPNMNNMDNPNYHKRQMIIIMTVTMAEYKAGYRKLDDRDSWSYKRVETAARMMEKLFSQLMKKVMKRIEDKIDKIKDLDGVKRAYVSDIITQGFFESFNTSNWGIKGISIKPNVAQSLKRANNADLYSHITRLDVETTRHDKQPTIRAVQQSQYGFICFIETPEGDSCGILKNLAMTTKVTVDQPDITIVEAVQGYYSYTPEGNTGKLMINGRFYGFCDVAKVYAMLLDIRRHGKNRFPEGTSIVITNNDYLEIYTDGSRPIRPLCIVGENQQLELDNKNMRGRSFVDQVNAGCIEYVDPLEQEYIKLASSVTDIRFRLDSIKRATEYYEETSLALQKAEKEGVAPDIIKEMRNNFLNATSGLEEALRSKPYTHCEVDPQAILGIAASLSPMPQHNQAPRNVYQASMIKQALCYYHSNHGNRMNDNKMKILAYPSRPFFEPQMSEHIGLHTTPMGSEVRVMIGTWRGFNMEDAFIWNARSLQQGKFRLFKYFTKTVTIESNSLVTEKLALPKPKDNEDPRIYAHLTDNGLPKIGAKLTQGDIVVGKIQINNQTGEEINMSEVLMIGDEGVVDKIYISKQQKTTVVKVKLRIMRIPIEGDKFSPRNAQKGTIGIILRPEDMPWSASGGVIDVIINPHCIPSRMTMEYIIELLGAKAGAFQEGIVDATPFRPFDLNEFRRILLSRGYNSMGYETLYSGTSGNEINGQVYVGISYWQALKHHVKDKIQMRGRGAVKTQTHQPVRGRVRAGGLRFGEMERDNTISHGAAAFLQERLCHVSDAYPAEFCINCGTFASTDVDSVNYVCRYCTTKGKFAKVTIPYAYKYLTHTLAPAGIFMRLEIMTTEDYQKKKSAIMDSDSQELDDAEVTNEEVENEDEGNIIYDEEDDLEQEENF